MLISLLPEQYESEEDKMVRLMNDTKRQIHLECVYDLQNWEDLLTLSEDAPKGNVMRISTFILKKGETHFIGENAKAVSGIIFDIDEGARLDECYEDMKKRGIEFFIYTTMNHSEDINKYRLIIPFKKPIKVEQFKLAAKSLKKSELWTILGPDKVTLSQHCFDVPPLNTITYGSGKTGKFFDIKKHYINGKEIHMKERRERMKKEMERRQKGYSDKKSREYFEAIIKNKDNEFRDGNRDNWLYETINTFNYYDCEPDLTHELIDPYIDNLDDKTAKAKFMKQISY